MAYDGEVRVKLDLDTSDMDKETKTIYAKLQAQEAQFRKNAASIQEMTAKFKQFLKVAEEQNFSQSLVKSVSDSTIQKINSLSMAQNKLNSEMKITETQLLKMTQKDPFKLLKDDANKASSAIAGMGRNILNLAKTFFIFNLIQGGLRKLADMFFAFAKQDTVLSQSLEQLKYNLMTAFMPIWQSVLPALRTLIQALATAAKYVTAFFAAMTGKSLKDTQQQAKNMWNQTHALGRQAKNMKKVGKETKKAAGALADFDKISILQQDNQEKNIKDLGFPGDISTPKPIPIEFDTIVDDKDIKSFYEWVKKNKPVILALAGVLGVLTIAIWAMNSAWLASPITWIIAGIAALIAAGWMLYKNWDKIKELFINFWDGINKKWTPIGQWFEKFGQNIKNSWISVWNAMGNFTKKIINGILGYVGNFVNGFIRAINGVIGLLNKVQFTMPDWIPSWLGGGQKFGVNIPKVPYVNIPRLAQGAVLQGGNPFLAWVNDQPRGQTNVETPLKTMVDAFRIAMQDFNANTPNVTVEANGNMSELVRLLNFNIKKEQTLRGNSSIKGDVWV